jgi:GNAT superfamily N-acetyltransferase
MSPSSSRGRREDFPPHASSSSVVLRDYRPSDAPVVVPMWKEGFYEMMPYSYARLVSSPTTFLAFAGMGACALAAGSPITSGLLAGFGLLCYTPVGRALVGSLFWLSISLQARMSMRDIEKRWMRPSQTHFYVAEADGVPVGCVAVKAMHTLHGERVKALTAQEPLPGEASVWRLTVAPSARNLGVGRLLMERAESWARDTGCSHVSLITGNPESSKFYRKLGYENESESRARLVLFGPLGVEGDSVRGGGLFAALKLKLLRRRLTETKSIFVKKVAG